MRLAIMQPYFFPYVGYFQVIHAVDKHILHGGLNYLKKGWVNRNRILGPDGRPSYVHAEIRARSSHAKINDIELVPSRQWKDRFLRGISYNYRKSPFFDEVYALIEDVVAGDTKRLSELNKRSIVSICEFLGIRTTIETDDTGYAPLEARLSKPETDLRLAFPGLRLTVYSRRVVRILEICRQEGANTFVNAIGGTSLYDKGEFRANGVDLYFVETQPFTYPQRTSKFVPDLSIIDALMNCGRAGTGDLLGKYRLV